MGSHRTTSRRLQALSGMCVMVLVLLVFISHVIMAVQGSVLSAVAATAFFSILVVFVTAAYLSHLHDLDRYVIRTLTMALVAFALFGLGYRLVDSAPQPISEGLLWICLGLAFGFQWASRICSEESESGAKPD